MMDIEKLIEDLRGLLKQYGEKIPYGELVGAPWPYSRAGDLVWQDPEPYFIEQAATALSMLQVENEKLRAELEQVKRERDAAIKDIWVSKWTSCKYGKDCTFTSARTGFPDCAGCGDWEWRGIKED
jgi:hypothetical protein